jgi:hypothetical protein
VSNSNLIETLYKIIRIRRSDVKEIKKENHGDGRNGLLRVVTVCRKMDHKYVDDIREEMGITDENKSKKQQNSVALVRKRTIPTERPPFVSKVSANFCG